MININSDCSKNREVVFISNLANNELDLYTFNLPERDELKDLSIIRRLTYDSGVEINPKWSPDGSSIIYSYYKDTNVDIYLISAPSSNTTTPIPIATDTITNECNPTFSPDGKMIAYYSTMDGEKYDLWVTKNNGGDKTKVANNVYKCDIYGPCWLPYEGTPILIYIYATQDIIEMQEVISGRKEKIITGDKIMSDIDCFYNIPNKRIIITYSAVDENTRRKRIFIKEFPISTSDILFKEIRYAK